MPIYDKYVDIAIQAYHNDVIPGGNIIPPQIGNWNEYNQFRENLQNIFHQDIIDRTLDRSLWVYGHLFN